MSHLQADYVLRANAWAAFITQCGGYASEIPNIIKLHERLDTFDIITRVLFSKIALQHIKDLDDDKARTTYVERILHGLNNLKEAPDEGGSDRPHVSPKKIADAFSSQYVDTRNLVLHYSRKLRDYSKAWENDRTEYNAPYTSLVNSSMMGKSRFQKQLCSHDPVLYFCFRSDTSGYPPASVPKVIDFFDNPFDLKSSFSTNPNVAQIEQSFVIAYILFFTSLFKQVTSFLSQHETTEEIDEIRKPRQRRMALWNLLAEPERSNEDQSEFWDAVFKRLKPSRFKKATEAKALSRVRRAYNRLPVLCDSENPSDHILILVFDEARVLTEYNLDGQKSVNACSGTTKFRILRRSLRSIGGKCPKIFSIMTDTSSRVMNFQPRGDTDSSREPIKESPSPKMFPPIVILPGVDVAAKCLEATCDPQQVQSPKRLMSFGRVAWHVMAKNTDADDLLQLAISKLIRRDSSRLAKLFGDHSPSNNRKLLACLGPRLALQIGSFCEDARELVASHMMFLEHVGDEHEQLFARYLSEPILAEASAHATAEHGWDAPLEALLCKILHGVVDRGFRGEFVTKVLLCIAMEDAQRQLGKPLEEQRRSRMTSKKPIPTQSIRQESAQSSTGQDNMDLDSISTNEEESSEDENSETSSGASSGGNDWHYSKVVRVSGFLNSLLQQPLERNLNGKQPSDGAPQEHVANGSFVQKFLLSALKPASRHDGETKHLTPEMRNRCIQFLNGYVFFNHFIRAEATLEPSLLVKAWNRNAAIMCQEGATGADYVIPVFMDGSEGTGEATNLGKCTSAWTMRQEETASKNLTYIIIQTKARQNSTGPLRTKAIKDCMPLDKTLSLHPNFINHTPQNPFLSILLELGCNAPRGTKSVQIHWIRSHLHEKMDQNELILEKAKNRFEAVKKAKGNKEGKPIQEAREAYESAKTKAHATTVRYNLAQLQIPLVVFGLNSNAFKCLETRPKTTAILEQLLTVALDPAAWLDGVEREELLESRSLRSSRDKGK